MGGANFSMLFLRLCITYPWTLVFWARSYLAMLRTFIKRVKSHDLIESQKQMFPAMFARTLESWGLRFGPTSTHVFRPALTLTSLATFAPKPHCIILGSSSKGNPAKSMNFRCSRMLHRQALFTVINMGFRILTVATLSTKMREPQTQDCRGLQRWAHPRGLIAGGAQDRCLAIKLSL